MRPMPWPYLGLVGVGATLVACASIDTPRKSGLTTEARLQVAQAAEASGDTDLAISMYTAAAASEPSNTPLQIRCADALTRAGKITQARQMLTDRLKTDPGQPDLVRALALVDLVAGQPAQAIAGFDQLLAANPGDVRALVDRAVALDLQGHHAAAQAIYRQVLATQPNDPATTNNLAVSLMMEGRTREALETLAPLRDVADAPQRLKMNLGILYAASGDTARSRQMLADRISENELATITRAVTSAHEVRNAE